ncbi:RanGTP-binding protein-domain-containing protein [Rhypophila decipiens]|uniref:RanGTP-binding protein-domain-containing protein n=1 Tax=Rhypophila decipiens TaxID=261697 RepID=A0AAN7BDX5_9PEZI|nr:RanGTP-binding protein-domain-containing protein [Rhypophila decipiens]
MDALLERLGVQAVNFAIRSGIALTSSYAARQCSKLLQSVNDKALYAEIKSLQRLLDSKIKILSPAIDLIEFKSGRGNGVLEGALPLVKSLHRDIVRLGKRLDDAASSEESARLRGQKVRMTEAYHAELTSIINDMKKLLKRIDDDIPLIQLAISSSGAKMSSTLSPGISPSRILHASNFLTYGDAQFRENPTRPVQIGPSFTLSLYMLFLGHSQPGNHSNGESAPLASTQSSTETMKDEPYGFGAGERKPIWQEVMHKARVRIIRTPPNWTFDSTKGYHLRSPLDSLVNGHGLPRSAIALLGRQDEYSYHIELVEDLDDGRLHEDDGHAHDPYDGITMAGIRESIPIHQVSKIFYTDTGRILNIRDAADGDNNPVLLLKRDPHAEPPIRIRQAWFEEAAASDYGSRSSTPVSDDQTEIDRQLREETESIRSQQETQPAPPRTGNLPPHVDPEWLALEVYADDESETDSETAEEEDPDDSLIGRSPERLLLSDRSSKRGPRSSVESSLVAQIRNITLQSPDFSPSPSPSPRQIVERSSSSEPEEEANETVNRVFKGPINQSPFGNIISSLSLLEMLIRFTSLQEFQQTNHMSAPDYILNFFLEETSTTGLKGEARWQLRNKTKRHVGFDPYTDTPQK